MAEEMGIAYELKPIGPRTGETQTPEYTQMTRKQKVPFMQSDEVSLSESLAICRYMQMIFAPGALYVPEDTATRQGRRVVPLCMASWMKRAFM